MSFLIEDILLINDLKNITLVAGNGGIYRPIKWVTILEVLDELNFLESENLLITTGYGLESNPSLQEKLIPYLVDKGLAGIGIQLGYYLNEIPEIILEQANELNFPVLLLPKNLSFNKLTQSILKQLINHQFHLLEYSEKIYFELTKIVLKNQDLSMLASSLEKIIKHSVIFTDVFYNELYNIQSENIWVNIMNILPNMPVCLQQPKITEYTLNHNTYILATPITTGIETLGYLFIHTQQKNLNEFESIAISHTATLAAMILLKEAAITDTKSYLYEDFLNETLSGNFSSKILTKKASLLGYDCTQGFCVVIIDFKNSIYQTTSNISNNTLYFYKHRILILVQQYLSQHKLRYMYKLGYSNLMLFVQITDKIELVQVNTIMSHMKDKLCKTNIDYTFSIGISNYHQKLEKLHQANQEATKALKLGNSSKQSSSVTMYSQIEIYNLFYELAQNSCSQSFLNDCLGQLLDYESKNKSQLLSTLESFFEFNCNIQQTADALFIHRHTLRYRLNKIHQLTTLNPFIAKDKLKLQLAIMLAKYID